MKKGTHHTEETKRKMSENHYDNSGANNPNYGNKWTEERKQKSSATKMGHSVSQETRDKISASTRGENHHNYGKHRSEETRQKVSKSNMGKVRSAESIEKWKTSHKVFLSTEENRMKLRKPHIAAVGKVRSEEVRKRISEVHTGKVMSEETKEKIRAAALIADREQKTIYQYDLQGNLIAKYSSLGEVERQLGFNKGKLSRCCNGKCKTGYGFIWKKA